MAFRFQKRVRLMPGVRMNFSKSGVSLSFGGRGATLNVSSRGVRSTVGIPGTGMSWSRQVSSGGRAPTRRQIEAAIRRAEREARVAEATALVERHESQLRDVVEQWREMPDVPRRADYERCRLPRPFEETEPAPAPPNERDSRRALRASLRKEAIRALNEHPARFALLLPLAGGLAAAALDVDGALPIGLGSFVGVVALLLLLRAAIATLRTRRQLQRAWPEHWREEQQRHAAAHAAWEARQGEARAKWDMAERERIAFVERLLAGDPEAVEMEVSSQLQALDFPFETACDVATSDGAIVYLAVDLPEIEDVIPETKHRVLKDGTIKEARRTNNERGAAYAELACGLAIQLARCAVAAAPTVREVHVGAYTQRRQRGSGALTDEWVYELAFDRANLEQLEPESVDPVDLAKRLPGRIDLRSTMRLARIDPPEWAFSFEAARSP